MDNNFDIFEKRQKEYDNHVPNPDNVHLFWKDFPYKIDFADGYFERKGMTQNEIDEFCENDNNYEIWKKINQVISILIARFLFSHTRGGYAGEMMDYLIDLVDEIIKETKEKYNYEIDLEMIRNSYVG